ncbi:ABC1 kinase family protein [Streptomyces johnsoniae]|uniref:AarF/UbiB family protein n=1 Tax=Streptomyces johnsoniae TaxID=3075532 RepID=A0ABU2S8Y1_9ACTN|nr:AarF/UbiB family protein [Streptomyces sp. DSM 41886]MDT0444254.1 AarF/UbiB family protein [Streptomyces sp. DSM 41886]
MSSTRRRVVTRVLGDLLATEIRNIVGPRRGGLPAQGIERARKVRAALEDLGPFWIKVGQILSTRPDIVPEYVLPELAKLHDHANVLPFSQLEPVLDEELGPGWTARFSDIDTDQPLGAASLAQVYRADLPDGRAAVVKIQRPGVRDVMLQDMALLRRTTRLIGRAAPRFSSLIDAEAMLAVIFDAMRPELDFTSEARNMKRARELASGFDHLAVPYVYTATPRVLVQSLAPGTSIRHADPDAFTTDERMAIGRDLLSLLFRGFFVDRFFHADPHPGNVFVAPGKPATLIDWGMVGRIDRRTAMLLVLILLNLAQNDGHGLATAWAELGHATPRAQQAAFMNDMAMLVPKIADASLGELDFGITLTKIVTCSTKRGISTNPAISLLGKAFGNVEGSVRCLAPELSVVDVFREELITVLRALVAETTSTEQIARTTMELLIGIPTVAGQVRGLLRGLAGGVAPRRTSGAG